MDKDHITFCGLRFSGLRKDEILKNPNFQQIITVGAQHIINAHDNPKLKDIINNNTSTFDGQVPYAIAKKKFPNIYLEKISGADFIYDICKEAKENNRKIFLLGGYPDSNYESVEKMKSQGITAAGLVTGFIPYPFPSDRLDEIKKAIADFKPYYLFVGLGMGKQEYIIAENKQFLIDCGVRMAIGCGGTMEVFSGKIVRAPKWIQKCGLEGFYRVLKEPNMRRIKNYMAAFKMFKYIND